MAASLKTVAEEAGLSIATVNQILNGYTDRFAKKTCVLVQKTATKVGYQPNLAARALQQKKSFLIGVLFSDDNSPLFSDFARGVMKGLGDRDYSPIILSGHNTTEEAACLDRCLHRQVDGLIINITPNPDGTTNAKVFAEVRSTGLPIIEVFGSFLKDVPKVNVDMAATAQKAVEYLVSAGHHSIILLTHDQYRSGQDLGTGLHNYAYDQVSRYKQTMLSHGFQPHILTGLLNSDIYDDEKFVRIGYDAADKLLALSPRPTAVICYNDDIAWGLCKACMEKGVSVPDDLSIIGYGNDKISRISHPSLTTFRRPVIKTAEISTQLLLNSIEGNSLDDVILMPELIERESTSQIAPESGTPEFPG